MSERVLFYRDRARDARTPEQQTRSTRITVALAVVGVVTVIGESLRAYLGLTPLQ